MSTQEPTEVGADDSGRAVAPGEAQQAQTGTARASTDDRDAWSRFRERPWHTRLRAPVAFFALGVLVFSLFAWERLAAPSPDNHFVYLAESYLSGTLEMLEDPPHGNDWASYWTVELASGQELSGIWYDRGENKFLDLEGNLYILERPELRGAQWERHHFVSFPPLPAVLMLPGVAIWGQDFNDVWFTIFFAALNLALMYSMLRWLALTGRTERSTSDNIWLTAMFGFGTAHLWCSVMGAVWFTALVVGVTFTLLYIRAAFDARHPFIAGLCLALAFSARTPLLFSVVFFAWFFFFPGGRFRRDWGAKFFRDGALFAAAPIVIGIVLMMLNHARFESYSEFGHTYLANGQLQRIKDYGLFNVHFLSMNLTAMFTLLPKFLPDAPYVVVSRHGVALWLTTPALLYLLWPRRPMAEVTRNRMRACWAAVAIIVIPHIFYQNTGWAQFGYRFSMDYVAYLTLLLAMGGRELTWRFKLLILLGIGANSFGAVTFNRFGQFYGDFFIEAS